MYKSNTIAAPTLLLVDDDEPFLRVLSRAMSRRGYFVWPVSSVAAALQTIATLSPDFAVVDLRLDDGNGLDVVRHIHDQSPQTTVLMLSGYANVRCAAAAARLGAVDCLAKPVDADELDKALKSARSGRTEFPDHFMHPDEARLQHILVRWAKNDWNTTKTADELGLHRRSLQRMLRRAGFANAATTTPANTKVMARFPDLARFWAQTMTDRSSTRE